MTSDKADKMTLTVAVRDLAERVRRQGGLVSPLHAGISGSEGSGIHREFVEEADQLFPDQELFPELTLRSLYTDDSLPFKLQIQGRCDLVTLSPQGRASLIEVKGFRGQAASIPPDGDPAHLAQALIYAHMLLAGDFLSSHGGQTEALDLELRYIPLDRGQPLILRSHWTKSELAAEFEELCRVYAGSLAPLYKHRALRDKANQTASFPYEDLRQGQKELMQEVLAAIRDKTVLFVQAATGIGKTMATLYPAIKAQANQLTDRIFYLTPTRSQRKVAEDSLDELESKGFRIRSLTLQAKQAQCLAPELYCDMRRCPYALNFYDNLQKALLDSYAWQRLTPARVRELAEKHEICPFELSLALIPTTDVVICDYNYIFNPRIRFHTLLDDPDHRYTLLVDEAHNLARRSREMFSARLAKSDLLKLKEGLGGLHKVYSQGKAGALSASRLLDSLIGSLESFRKFLTASQAPDGEDPFLKDLKEYRPVCREHFLATKSPPAQLLDRVSKLTAQLTGFFQAHEDFPGRQAFMVPYFELLHFQRVAERYYDQAYITSWRPGEKDELFMTLLALDASRHLTEIYRGRSPVVFFSATLSPLPYYISLLDAQSRSEKPEIVELKSPFPSERRLVICYEEYSLRYGDRALSLEGIARLISQVVRLRRGNYLVFSPSFSYQGQLVKALSRQKAEDIDYVVQPPGMTEKQKNRFLDYFQNTGRDKPLVGLTVMGSLLNEGIDLKGEALTGVIVIGTGLPGLSPERDILRQYYDERQGQGFEFAYVWPGFNRVTQAVGRLIRGGEDYGLALLIDDRYGRPDYRQLIPEDWQARHTGDRQACTAMIQDFWKDFSSPSQDFPSPCPGRI